MNEFTCEYCNKTFQKPSGHQYRFCSRQCKAQSINTPDPSKKKVFTCRWCGGIFEEWAYRKPSFCSRQCAGEYGARQPKPNKQKPETMKVDRMCEICGSHFTTNIYQITLRAGGKYCSRKCKGEATSRRLRADGGPNYKGGVARDGKYYRGSNWDRQKRFALKRDNYTCQVCHQRRSILFRVEVHHIKPYRLFDGDFVSANNLSNLVSLCKKDHGRVESGKIPCPKPKQ